MIDPSMSKIEGKVETKSSCDKFFGVLSNEVHRLPNASSDKIQHIEVHEGCWKTSGSVKLWKYVMDGVVEEFKERVEVDEENKMVSLTGLEGHVLDLYKTYKIIFHVIPKTTTSSQDGGLVKITVQYEKRDDNVPAPTKYLDYVIHLVNDLDQHIFSSLINNNNSHINI